VVGGDVVMVTMVARGAREGEEDLQMLLLPLVLCPFEGGEKEEDSVSTILVGWVVTLVEEGKGRSEEMMASHHHVESDLSASLPHHREQALCGCFQNYHPANQAGHDHLDAATAHITTHTLFSNYSQGREE